MEFYASSIWAAGKLDEAAHELGGQVAGLEEFSSTLYAGWKGEAAQMLSTFITQYETELKTSQLQIRELAGAVRETAMRLEAIRQAEKLASAAEEAASDIIS